MRVLNAYITAFEYSGDGLDELDGNNHNPLWEHGSRGNDNNADARSSGTGFELTMLSTSGSDANAAGSNPMHGPGGARGAGGGGRPGEHERDRPPPTDFRLSTGAAIFDPAQDFDISASLDGYKADEHSDSFHVASMAKAEVCYRVVELGVVGGLFAICYLLFAICYLLFAICYFLFAICYLIDTTEGAAALASPDPATHPVSRSLHLTTLRRRPELP